MKRIAALFLFTLIATGCGHTQPTPTTGYQTSWSWTAPTTGSCTSTCKYIVSTLVVTSGTASCPTATGQYIPQQTATTALSATTWTQANTTGLTNCAVVSSVFAGATSAASVPSSPVVSPALPTAPGIPSGTPGQSAELVKPIMVPYSEPVLMLSKNLGAPTLISGKVQRSVR